MKNRSFSIPFLLLLSLCSSTMMAQEKPVTFKVEVSSDSILMDNYFQVRFTVENADGQNFEAPDFTESFDIVSGPNFSTSVTMLNGEMTQHMNITYYLRPREVGIYYIQPASVYVEGELLETAPLEVLVHPNPAGIQQSPPMQGSFQFEFGDPFRGSSPFDDLFKGFDSQMMPFSFEEFFKGFDSKAMPFGMDEFFKNFGEEGMPQDMQKWFEQFDLELPEMDGNSLEDGEKTAPKKKRKTTRI